MSNIIQKRINELKPYVIGIRFVDGLSVIDTVLKDGWKVPTSKIILTGKIEDSPTYHMFYSENENIGIDELLDFISETIKINIEREKKFELLGIKFKELETLFKNNSLDKLQNMRFVLGDVSLMPETISENFLIPEYTIDSLDKEEMEEVKEVEEIKPNIDEINFNSKLKNQDVELPPRGTKIEVEEFIAPPMSMQCKHGPETVCPNCIDY